MYLGTFCTINMDHIIFKKKRKIFWLVIFFIVSCSSSKPDSGFFGSGGSCLPPCWNDILPGTTVKDDAVLILSNLEYVSPNSLSESKFSEPGAQGYKFRFRGGSHGEIVIRDGIVFELFLEPDFYLTLSNLMDRFGAPDYLFIQSTGGNIVCYETHLYYPDRGIMLYLHECEKIGGEEQIRVISGEELVTNIVYFEPSTKSYEEVLLELWQPYDETAQHISAYSEPWDGFKYYRPQSASSSGREGIPRPPLQ